MSAVAVALETSTRAPSIAVRSGEQVARAQLDAGRSHAADLLPALERLLRSLGESPSSIGAVVAGTGPGSYTGLRVGIATALGLARASGARLLGVPSTDTLAFGHLRAGEQAAVVLDARAREFYFARYSRSAESLDVLDVPCVLERDALRSRLAPGELVFADDDAVRAAGLEELGLELRSDARPRAEDALDLALARAELGLVQAVEPLYLRAFAASSRKR
jgi:tRNA threonylcarbamoyladenosine biosynthesis protein TsaB